MHANRFARACLFLFVFCFVPASTAAEPFVVDDIKLEGLQRISAGTVFNYLPIKVGDRIDSKRTGEALRALYKTGFFRDVRLEKEGNSLVVFLHERPSIANIEFTGNKELSTEDLLKSLEQEGFAQGRVFNRSTFDLNGPRNAARRFMGIHGGRASQRKKNIQRRPAIPRHVHG